MDTFLNRSYSDVYNQLLNPLLADLLPQLQHTRACPALSDRDWLACGICRTLDNVHSGRDFLQRYAVQVADLPDTCPERSHFFESLKSTRRLNLCAEASTKLARSMQSHTALARENRLQIFTELDGFDLYAGDGHFHAAAVHDEPADDGKRYAVGHLYTLNLRTHALTHLCLGDQIHRKKEHDMRALKRQSIDALRQGAPTGKNGRKVLYVWDRAGIDFYQWHKWKQSSGLYFLSRVKDNMRLETIAVRSFDANNSLNIGVHKDELVATSVGVSVRRITYTDPATDSSFQFITSEMNLSPGILVQLYRMRWDIEKVFDEVKNRLHEQKAWASSATAKTMQAHFICMTHNLMTLLEAQLMDTEGIRNTAEETRRRKRILDTRHHTRQAGRGPLPYAHRFVQRITQRSVKFIRWLRIYLFSNAPWKHACATLAQLYATP